MSDEIHGNITAGENLAKRLANLAVSIGSRGSRALGGPGYELVKILQSNSPVRTGFYRRSWRMRRGSSSKSVPAQIIIDNTAPYAVYMETGSEPGKPPWPTPNPPPKGHTVEEGGRIWPSIAVGGVINKSLKEFGVDEFVKHVAESLTGDL